jgi:hypothetical protein
MNLTTPKIQYIKAVSELSLDAVGFHHENFRFVEGFFTGWIKTARIFCVFTKTRQDKVGGDL